MLTSGSGLERHIHCRMSNVLERAFDADGSEHATRGVEAHAHLQRVGGGMEEQESLDMVDEHHRDACAGIDLDELRDVLGLTAELTLAYRPMEDTARVLGVGLEREYEAAGIEPDEIPVTMDVVGLDGNPPTRGSVYDFKTGWAKLAMAGRNWQMRGGALALSRAFDVDVVDAQLIYLREGVPARRDRAVFTAADLAGFAAESRARWILALEDRARRERTGDLPDATQGSWCRFCPSYHACPPKIGLVRSLVIDAESHALIPAGAMRADEIADAFKRLQDLKAPLKLLERALYAAARERPVLLERQADGTEIWLGTKLVESPERIDAVKAREVVREMLDDKAVDEVSVYEVTKGRLEAAIKTRVPKGKGAEKMRAVLGELRKRGGAHRPTKHDVVVYPIKPRQLAAKGV
jgi:hypothetical protein